jgi:hypothetical protein
MNSNNSMAVSAPRFARGAALSVCGLAVTAALAAYVSLAQFARFSMDDFVLAQSVQKYGCWGAGWEWYTALNGRFGFHLIAPWFYTLGEKGACVAPVVVYLAWYMVAVWCAALVALRHPWRYALQVSAAIIYCTMTANAAIGEVLWWEAGVLGYPTSAAGITALVGILLSNWRPAVKVAAAAAVTLVSGGILEQTVAAETALALVCLVAIYLSQPQEAASYRKVCYSVLATAAVVLVLMVLAPGTRNRLGFEGQRLHLATFAWYAAKSPLGHVGRFVYLHAWQTAILFGLGVLLGCEQAAAVRPWAFSRTRVRDLLLSVAGVWFLLAACNSPVILVYGTSGAGGRQAFLPDLVTGAAFLAFGFLAGRNLAWPGQWPQWARVAAALLLAMAALAAARDAGDALTVQRRQAARIAAEFDRQSARLSTLAAGGAREASVGYFVFWEEVDVREARDCTSLHNWPVAKYYGLERVYGNFGVDRVCR